MAAATPSNSLTNSQISANQPSVPNPEPKQDSKQERKSEPPQEADADEMQTETMEGPNSNVNDPEEERVKRFQKYEADFKQYLMAKYFSDKTIFGGNIFDVKVNMDGQTTMASRLPLYQSYLDPATFEEMTAKRSSSPTEGQGPSTSKE